MITLKRPWHYLWFQDEATFYFLYGKRYFSLKGLYENQICEKVELRGLLIKVAICSNAQGSRTKYC